MAAISFNELFLPISLQSMAVLVLPLAFKPRIGAVAVALYLVLGGLGVPVFAGGVGGFQYFTSTSGGYLVGFFIVAALGGFFLSSIENKRYSLIRLFLLFILLHGILTLCGLSWLWIKGIATPFAEHVSPFLPGAVVKSLLGALIVEFIWILDRQFRFSELS